MTLADIKKQALFQYNNDTDPVDDFDFLPHLVDYINEGYEDLYWNWTDEHVDSPLREERDVPLLPEWAHRAVADYATYLIYRNGSSARQNRGQAYLSNFMLIRNKLRDEKDDNVRNFHNIPL